MGWLTTLRTGLRPSQIDRLARVKIVLDEALLRANREFGESEDDSPEEDAADARYMKALYEMRSFCLALDTLGVRAAVAARIAAIRPTHEHMDTAND